MCPRGLAKLTFRALNILGEVFAARGRRACFPISTRTSDIVPGQVRYVFIPQQPDSTRRVRSGPLWLAS